MSQSYAFTMPSASNAYLLVEIVEQSGTTALSGASYAGKAMTLIGSNTDAVGGGNLIVYGIAAPLSGANNVGVSFTAGANNDQWVVEALAFSGVNPSQAIGADTLNGPSTSSPFTDSISTLASQSLVVDLLENNQNNFPTAENSGQSATGVTGYTSGYALWSAYKAVGAAGTQTLSYNWTPSGQSIEAWTLELEAAPCASPTNTPSITATGTPTPAYSSTATPFFSATQTFTSGPSLTPTITPTYTLGAACTTTPVAGATTSFTSYEAENGTLGGGASIVAVTTPPNTWYSSAALEASGHSYVTLNGDGQSVQWTNNTGQNISAINLRSSIPDALTGGGLSSTIDLYVNGVFRQAFPVNSTQNYCYEEEGVNYADQTDKTPASGYYARDFWNDTRAFVSGAPIAPGSTFSFQMDSSNNATSYGIDVVDVENPPAALTEPSNAISITDAPYNAVPNNPSVDNTSAINACFAAAQSQGKIAWIPAETFYFSAINGGLQATGITIEGAGEWYSTLYRMTPAGNTQGIANMITGVNCTLENVFLDCNAVSRANDNNNGAVDFSGSNWLVDNVWIEHVTSSFWCAGDHGMVENCRTLSTWADGGNFNNVQDSRGVGTYLTYTNNFVRGTGDDAMAINSVNYNGSTTYTMMSYITYSNNTAIAPWGGKGIGIYGGVSDTVVNNYMSDTARYLGLGVMRFGTNGSDLLSVSVTGNVIVRCGGNGYGQQQQAMMIGNGGDGQGVGTDQDAFIGYNTINNALFDAIGFSDSGNMVLQNNVINSPGLNGIAVGNATIDLGTVTGCAIFQGNVFNNVPSGSQAIAPQTGSTLFTDYTPTLASNYSGMSGISTQSCSEGGQNVDTITSGSYTYYNNVNLNGMQTFVARVASAGTGGSIQIRLDSPTGTLVGTCTVPATGCWQGWVDAQCGLNASATGTHNIYLVYQGGAGDLFNLEWFSFTNVAYAL